MNMAPGLAYLDAFSAISKAFLLIFPGKYVHSVGPHQKASAAYGIWSQLLPTITAVNARCAGSSRHTFTKENTNK